MGTDGGEYANLIRVVTPPCQSADPPVLFVIDDIRPAPSANTAPVIDPAAVARLNKLLRSGRAQEATVKNPFGTNRKARRAAKAAARRKAG